MNDLVTATVAVRGSVERISAILLDVQKLADWNPAFLSIGSPDADGACPIRVRGGLRGSFRYTRTEGLRLESAWQVPGLSETNYWILRPDGDQTIVEHGFQQHGLVATLLRGAFATAGQLRVNRLKDRVETGSAHP
jgi:hypothetical protein